MSIPTEAERLAGYKASMAATVAASGKSSRTNWAPGAGALQTADTARHIYDMTQKKAAQASTLTPAQIIEADAAARIAARAAATAAGRTLSDTDIQRAGREGIAAAKAAL